MAKPWGSSKAARQAQRSGAAHLTSFVRISMHYIPMKFSITEMLHPNDFKRLRTWRWGRSGRSEQSWLRPRTRAAPPTISATRYTQRFSAALRVPRHAIRHVHAICMRFGMRFAMRAGSAGWLCDDSHALPRLLRRQRESVVAKEAAISRLVAQ